MAYAKPKVVGKPREAYHAIRQHSERLRHLAGKFEGTPWHRAKDGAEERYAADGSILRSYFIEGEPEVTVIHGKGSRKGRTESFA